MFSQLKSFIFSVTSSPRDRFELGLLASGTASGILAGLLLAGEADHLRATLLQYANKNHYQLSNLTFETAGFISFVRELATQHALAPTILLSLSLISIIAFASSAAMRAAKVPKLSTIGQKSSRGIYRLAISLSVTFLMLALLPGSILVSASEEASRAFGAFEKTQNKVWADAEAETARALTASLNAHADRMAHLTAKMRAEMDCRRSPSGSTYFTGNSYVESGYYNSCSLKDYLERRDFSTTEDVGYADLRLSSAQELAESALEDLKNAKDNVQTLSTVETAIRVSQLSLFSLSGMALLLTLAGIAPKILRERTKFNWRESISTKPGGLLGRAKCPKCAEYVKLEALICKHCGSDIRQSTDVGSA